VATYIDTDAGLAQVAQHLRTRDRVAVDLETTGLDPLKDEILLVGIDEYAILGRLDLAPLKPLIEDNELPKVIFNASFDGMFLQRRGMLPYRVWDPMIGAMLLKCGLHSLPGTFTLENLLHQCLGVSLPPGKHDMQMSFVGVDPSIWIPSPEQIDYVCSDTAYLTRLSDYMQDRIEQCGLLAVWRLENAVTQVVAQMQIQGIPLNVPAYTHALGEWESDFEKIEKALQSALTPAILEVRRRQTDETAAAFDTWQWQHDLAWEYWGKEFDVLHPDAPRSERRKALQAQDRKWRDAGHPRPVPPRLDPEPINLGSAPQVKAALKEMGISLMDKKRATILGAKVGQGVEMQAVLNQLAQYSKLDKQLGTYGRSMLENMDSDNRIRCRFTQIIATGRRASSKFHDEARNISKGANLQNFPKPSRDLVQPLPGRKFVIGDYSQIELRVAAEYALQRNPQADDALIRAFRDGSDPHAEMAAVAFGLDLQDLLARVKDGDEVAIKQRWAGKTTNFSALFGIAGKTLAVRIHEMMLAQIPDYMVPLTDTDIKSAKLLLEAFRSMNPTILACLDDWRRQALNVGYTTTMAGRRRYFQIPARSDPEYQYRRGQIEREAGNQPIQGTSADITKLAEIKIQRAFHANGWPAVLINSVHDESMVETDERYALRACVVVKHHMTDAFKQWIKRVPCALDVGVQDSWRH
jgi:DNA polymerase I-like protein with 3'-5' exonuclease and polymerase domains